MVKRLKVKGIAVQIFGNKTDSTVQFLRRNWQQCVQHLLHSLKMINYLLVCTAEDITLWGNTFAGGHFCLWVEVGLFLIHSLFPLLIFLLLSMHQVCQADFIFFFTFQCRRTLYTIFTYTRHWWSENILRGSYETNDINSTVFLSSQELM